MKSRLKQILTMTIPLLLPVILGVLFFGLMPGYNSPEKRADYLQEQLPGCEILSETLVEDKYLVCQIQSESSLGFGLFQKTLGKWKADDLVLSEENTAIGDFYLNDDHYYVIVTRLEGAAEAALTFVETPTGKALPGQRLQAESSGLFFARTDLEGTLTDILFYDTAGNEIKP